DGTIRREGPDRFRRRMDEAVPWVEFRLKVALRGHDVETVAGRARAVAAVVPVLAEVESAVAREGYVERLARALSVSPHALMADLEAYMAGQRNLPREGAPGASRHRLAGRRDNKKGFRRVDAEQGGGPFLGSSRGEPAAAVFARAEQGLLGWVLTG